MIELCKFIVEQIWMLIDKSVPFFFFLNIIIAKFNIIFKKSDNIPTCENTNGAISIFILEKSQ